MQEGTSSSLSEIVNILNRYQNKTIPIKKPVRYPNQMLFFIKGGNCIQNLIFFLKDG